jgi:hypothetical protein
MPDNSKALGELISWLFKFVDYGYLLPSSLGGVNALWIFWEPVIRIAPAGYNLFATLKYDIPLEHRVEAINVADIELLQLLHHSVHMIALQPYFLRRWAVYAGRPHFSDLNQSSRQHKDGQAWDLPSNRE